MTAGFLTPRPKIGPNGSEPLPPRAANFPKVQLPVRAAGQSIPACHAVVRYDRVPATDEE